MSTQIANTTLGQRHTREAIAILEPVAANQGLIGALREQVISQLLQACPALAAPPRLRTLSAETSSAAATPGPP